MIEGTFYSNLLFYIRLFSSTSRAMYTQML